MWPWKNYPEEILQSEAYIWTMVMADYYKSFMAFATTPMMSSEDVYLTICANKAKIELNYKQTPNSM